MKQTAVEWLVDEMIQRKFFEKETELSYTTLEHLTNQAKELEKQQQGYSEEEVIELLQKALTHQDDGETGSLVTAQGEIRPANFFSWLNKFKKK